jgi:DNA modification methylase
MNITVNKGTTAIACHNLNRRFICIERDFEYYTKSVERYNKHIQQQRLF